MKNIEDLIEDGGHISLDAEDGHACVATASDVHNVVAMLVRRDGETLAALLRRLDRAIGKFFDDGQVIDEVYGD
jgi:predicted RNase H-like HicB family nuclease